MPQQVDQDATGQRLPQGSARGRRFRRLALQGHVPLALEHVILIAAWNMWATASFYDSLGEDHFNKLDPERAKQRGVAQLRRVGYQVTLQPLLAIA